MFTEMDAMQFEQRAREEKQLCAFLQEVAEDAAKQLSVEDSQRFDVTITGVGILFGVAAYALYRLVKDYLDAKILKKQAEVIKMLIEAGFPPELARATVISLLDRTAKRIEDDPVFKKAIDLVGKGK